ncbi:MAG: hypothetical protein LC725_08070 [Lentisphaerae bacterium]|nr:hypothetical protein [Lentisphaerota bacterium]
MRCMSERADQAPAHDAGFFMPDDPAQPVEGYRLVKGAKCPTTRKRAERRECLAPEPGKTPQGQPGAWGIIEYRAWAQEWRIRTQVETTAGTLPPDNTGTRETDHLTMRAAKIIAESCQFVATCKGGYRTFFTLTFDDDRRAAIAAGETTVQREVSRFMDGLSRMWSRGWKTREKTPAGKPIGEAPRSGDLLYLWVAECPKNEDGEDNPHVHVLVNWRVKYAMFQAWAARIEALWGQGFAHIEKLRDANAAGGYMLKALGYMTKGKEGDQGKIRGNRYNLSRAARAPGWVCIERRQLHALGVLIADIDQHITETYGEQYQERKRLANTLATIPKKKTGMRRAVGRRLEQVRRDLADAVPVVASKYQILIKGHAAYREVREWLSASWHTRPRVAWLPEKGPGENWDASQRSESQWYAEQKRRIWWRRACRVAARMRWTDAEWEASRDTVEQWASLLTARDDGELNYGHC